MLLRGLAEAADLRLRVLVGEDALDRPVDGVFTTDLLDPRRYLTGGEIVLTGLMWWRTPADSESFVDALMTAGAVALAAGDAALGSVPDDLVVACRRHGLPLFEVPVDVSFAAITEQVLAARMRQAGPGPAVARLRALAGGRGRAEHGPGEGAARAGGAAGASLAEVLTAAADEFGVTGWVLSAAGRLVAGAPAAPGPRARSALAGAWLDTAELPVTVLADGTAYALFGVAGGPPHRLAGWFLALAGDLASWDADRRAIAAELAAITAGHRARHEEGRRAARRASDAAIARLLDRPAGATGAEDRETAAALRRGGLGPCGPLAVIALTAGPAPRGAAAGPPPGAAADPGPEAWPQVARLLLEEMLPGPVAGVYGGDAIALAPGTPPVLDRIAEVTRDLAGVYGPGAVPAGYPPGGSAELAAGTGLGGMAAEYGSGGMAAEYRPGGMAAAYRPGDLDGTAPSAVPGQSLGAEGPGPYPGEVASGLAAPAPVAAVPVPASLSLAFGVCVLSGATVQSGPRTGGAAVGAGCDGPGAAGDPVGTGGPEAGWTVTEIGRALAKAHQARRVAALLGGGVRVVDAAALGSVELLLATAPAEARRAFTASLLSPLLDYDADHGTELVRTLRVFLDCSGSWTKAAEAMFVHVNSLRYRMRRVEELTGRDLGSLADQAALLLALRLAEPEC